MAVPIDMATGPGGPAPDAPPSGYDPGIGH